MRTGRSSLLSGRRSWRRLWHYSPTGTRSVTASSARAARSATATFSAADRHRDRHDGERHKLTARALSGCFYQEHPFQDEPSRGPSEAHRDFAGRPALSTGGLSTGLVITQHRWPHWLLFPIRANVRPMSAGYVTDFVWKPQGIRSRTSRMPNGGHRSRRDVTLTTQVVSLAALVDPMRSGAKIAA